MNDTSAISRQATNTHDMYGALMMATTFEEPIVRAFKRNPSLHLNKVEGIELGPQYPDVYLTVREAHACLFVMLGFTSKEIAAKLFLSSRTIEHYIFCAKRKLRLTRKSNIVRALLQSDFIVNFSQALKELD